MSANERAHVACCSPLQQTRRRILPPPPPPPPTVPRPRPTRVRRHASAAKASLPEA